MMRVLRWVPTMWAIAVLVACSSGSPAPSPTPTRRPPANPVVDGLVAGQAHVVVTGGVEQTYDWELLGASDDPDTTVITWGHGLDSFDLLGMPGAILEGKASSSLQLWMDLRLDSIHQRFLSESGECSITLSEVEVGQLRGRLRCEELVSESGAKTITLVVRFSAGPR